MGHGRFVPWQRRRRRGFLSIRREVGLLSRYLVAHESRSVRRIVWLGPEVDWSDDDEVMCMGSWGKRVVEDCDLSHYELLVIRERTLRLKTSESESDEL